MQALPAGATAPEFQLKSLDGKEFFLREALVRGPVLLVFFKVSCPTCQYSFPFYERLFRKYRNRNVTLVAISQNNPAETAAFAREFGVTFPILLDDIPYPVSNAYGLTNVPTLFWISPRAESNSAARAGTSRSLKPSIGGWPKPAPWPRSRCSSPAKRCASSAPVEARKTDRGLRSTANSPRLRGRPWGKEPHQGAAPTVTIPGRASAGRLLVQ